MRSRWFAILVISCVLSVMGFEKGKASENADPPQLNSSETAESGDGERVVAPDTEPLLLAGGLGFTEGPVRDREGNVFFTNEQGVYLWSVEGTLSTYLENLNRPAGLALDRDGSLLICEKGNHRVIAVDNHKKMQVLAETYNGKPFNEPNDLWVDPHGGIYFSDPYYGKNGAMPQDGKHVYYITPDREMIIRVTNDVVHPNGVIGTPDGKHLYVADNRGEVKTWLFDIQEDGTLTNKRLHANEGADGVTLDTEGNIYLSMDKIYVYNPDGKKIDEIELPERPHNLCFFGEDNRMLFIAAGSSIYLLKMRTEGLY